MKLTSIASVVALPELLFQARQAQSVTYNATPIMVAAVAYFILLWPLVRVLSRLENRQFGRARPLRRLTAPHNIVGRPARRPLPHAHGQHLVHPGERPRPVSKRMEMRK